MIIDRGWIHPDDQYINVSLDLIRAIKHVPAMVVARVAYRTSGRWPGVITVDDLDWWTVSLDDIADDLCMSKRQMQRILAVLVEDGTLVRAKYDFGEHSVRDHTYSYRVNYGELPDSAEVDPEGEGEPVDKMSTSSPELLPNGTGTVTKREHRPLLKEVKKSLNARTREGSGMTAEPDTVLFQQFVEEWPTIIPPPALPDVHHEFRLALRTGDGPSAVIAGARAYAEQVMNRDPNLGVADPVNWLRDHKWRRSGPMKLKKPATPARAARLPLYVPDED